MHVIRAEDVSAYGLLALGDHHTIAPV